MREQRLLRKSEDSSVLAASTVDSLLRITLSSHCSYQMKSVWSVGTVFVWKGCLVFIGLTAGKHSFCQAVGVALIRLQVLSGCSAVSKFSTAISSAEVGCVLFFCCGLARCFLPD